MLVGADLVTLYNHLDRLAIKTDGKSIKVLVEIRKKDKRWSLLYESEVKDSIKM